jgi:hypothetical protein
MSDIRKAIKKIRGIPPKPIKITDPVDIRIAEFAGELKMLEEHDKQLAIKQEHNFAQMKAGKERQLQEIYREQERQREIEKKRLKNLGKARKVLRKMRENGET